MGINAIDMDKNLIAADKLLRRLRRTGALHSLQEAVIDGIAAYHITRLPELHRSLLINVTTCTVILCTGPHDTVLP